MQNLVVAQLESVIDEYNHYRSQSRHKDASDVIDRLRRRELQVRALAAIERAAGKSSVYYEQAIADLEQKSNSATILACIIGVAESLLTDIRAGYLKSLAELLHADVFSDFLEMGDHLISNGYKDAAAVMAGSTLEAHLKQLAHKFSIPVERNGKPKKADLINSELVKANAYSTLDQKNVTAWLDLRNKAAHGNYDEYDHHQVKLLISSIRDFITRKPA